MAPKFTLPGCALLLLLALSSCLKDDVQIDVSYYSAEEYEIISKTLDLPVVRDNYDVELAPHMVARGSAQPSIDWARATLGRVLFYDKKLSRNMSVSCASCHHQELAFADNVAFSKGFAGGLTKRNSLPLAATANFESSYDGGTTTPTNNNGGVINGPKAVLFFWDERAHSIAEQSINTIQDEVEMGMDLHDLSFRLRQEEYYRILFRKAYGEETVTPTQIVDALQEFCNSITSSHRRFDAEMNARTEGKRSIFTQQELHGERLFTENCSSCHGDMTRPGLALANNGLDAQYTDEGVGALTRNFNDIGVFKVPFLRNVARTAPYMHDGRFATLEAVIEHYSTGLQDHHNLHPNLRDERGLARRFNFTAEDKAALIAFLNTVTAQKLLQDRRFSDPFKK